MLKAVSNKKQWDAMLDEMAKAGEKRSVEKRETAVGVNDICFRSSKWLPRRSGKCSHEGINLCKRTFVSKSLALF